MPYSVLLTDDAARDLEDLNYYILLKDVPGKADHVLDEIEKAMDGLAGMPERGVYPRELLVLGIREYREVFLKTLSNNIPDSWEKSVCHVDCRWPSRYANPAEQTITRRLGRMAKPGRQVKKR